MWSIDAENSDDRLRRLLNGETTIDIEEEILLKKWISLDKD